MRLSALICVMALVAGPAVAAPSATSDLNVGSAADVDAVLSGEPNVECDRYGTDSRGGAITGNCRDAGPRIGELSSETELSIPDLMQQHSGTDAFTCIRYRAAGACFWLKCTAFPPSCKVRTSVLVTHYVNQRAKVTRFRGETASNFDHPRVCHTAPFSGGHLECFAWKPSPRSADCGWLRVRASVLLPVT